MSRKYRQRGYQDENSRPAARRRPRGSFREGPRSPRMTRFQEVFRCALCGGNLPPSFTDITPSSRCPQCSGDLHTCRNCSFFDPASRFECTEKIPERISPKDSKNLCEYFEARTSVEKATTSSKESRPALDPREAFERLFKK